MSPIHFSATFNSLLATSRAGRRIHDVKEPR